MPTYVMLCRVSAGVVVGWCDLVVMVVVIVVVPHALRVLRAQQASV
jgi:hypothetical protein